MHSRICPLFLVLALAGSGAFFSASALAGPMAGIKQTLVSCPALYERISADPEAAYKFRKRIFNKEDRSPPGSPPERRPKKINGNYRPMGVTDRYLESADPTYPMPMVGKGGKTVYRSYASGTDVFEGDSLEDFLRGGVRNRRRITVETLYPDGVTKAGGSYHRGSHVWDRLAVKWKNEDVRDFRFAADDPRSYKPFWKKGVPARRAPDMYGNQVDHRVVGYAGMMEQPFTLKGAAEAGVTEKTPLVEKYNYTRSRHAFDISLDNGQETWRSRGSLDHNKPDVHGNWLTKDHQHGYGGRPLLDENGYVKVYDGTPWMVYERVTEMRNRQPWKTEVVARRMKNPYEFFEKGEKLPDGRPGDVEVKLVSVNNKNGVPYPATDRHGMGYLFEGFNVSPHKVKIQGQEYYVGTGSPGNYVEDYGIVFGFRKAEAGPVGPFDMDLTPEGDLRNIARDFSKKYGITWTGRGDVFFDHEGKPWLIFHGVDIDNLPPNFPRTGWPKPEEFESYFRNQLLAPVEFYSGGGKPRVRIVDPNP